jgi:SAM-dependent methyltransferase
MHVLSDLLDKVDHVFGIDSVLQETFNEEKVSEYYRDSFFGYLLMHSLLGSIHLAVSDPGDEHFKSSGYLYQPRQIGRCISREKPTQILELGAGQGFNIRYLAKRFPNVRFVGIDITNSHLRLARLKSLCLCNVQFSRMSFDSTGFPDSEFGLIYDVESICHSNDMLQLLRSVHRLLKPGGLFLSFEGFREGIDNNDCRTDLETAVRLVEISMAVNRFSRLDEWLRQAASAGFKVETSLDLSERVLPNLLRFQRDALRFFDHPILRKTLLTVLPSRLLMNSIAGLLLAETVRYKRHKYVMLELRRCEPISS